MGMHKQELHNRYFRTMTVSGGHTVLAWFPSVDDLLLKGSVRLDGAKVIEDTMSETDFTLHAKERTLTLRAENSHDCHVWVETLGHLLKVKRGHSSSHSIHMVRNPMHHSSSAPSIVHPYGSMLESLPMPNEMYMNDNGNENENESEKKEPKQVRGRPIHDQNDTRQKMACRSEVHQKKQENSGKRNVVLFCFVVFLCSLVVWLEGWLARYQRRRRRRRG